MAVSGSGMSVSQKPLVQQLGQTQCWRYSTYTPITPFLAIMLDKIIVIGPWGPAQPHHLQRLAQITYSRFLTAKTKQTTTFINSPLTGAQMELVYSVKNVAGNPMGSVQITIPVATALIGHNRFHAGLEVIRSEIKCVELLVKILLVSIGMTPAELKHYMKMARPLLLELTWHNQTASVDARKAAQRRTQDLMRAKRELSSRHDVEIDDAQVYDSKSGTSLKVSFKNGNGYRQYNKAEQMRSRRNKERADNFVSDAMRPKLGGVTPELEVHTRNELLAAEQTLRAAGITHPSHINAKTVASVMESMWHSLGFDEVNRVPNESMLTDSAKDTLRRFMAGEDVTATLPAYRISRDRQAIKKAGGPEIDVRRTKRFRFNPANLGSQQHYKSRWRLRQELRELVVSECTAPAIKEELKQGLAFVTNGELPDITDADKRTAWEHRWLRFAREEWLGKLSAPEDTWNESNDNAAPDADAATNGSGIGDPDGSVGLTPLACTPMPEDQG